MKCLKYTCFAIGCALVLTALAASPAAASQESSKTANTVNAVLGDASWIAVHGEAPRTKADEVARIRTHLFFVIDLLEAADTSALSTSQQTRRARALEGLREYASAGVFPRRSADDGYGPRRPRFIDDRGVHCAVGELIRRSGRPELARAIDAKWEYAYVPDIDSLALTAWATRHGFEPRELAMIQPAYSSPPSAPNVELEIKRAKEALTLQCARVHEPPAAITLQIRGDERGNVSIATTDDADAFAHCFRQRAMGKQSPGGAWDTEPRAFQTTLKLDITPPKELFASRLESLQVGGSSSRCLPRPGSIPKEAKLHIQSNQEGATFKVDLQPANDEVKQCLTDQLRGQFNELARGGQWKIDLRADKTIEPTMTEERLRGPIPSAMINCADKESAPATFQLEIKANPKTQRFKVTADTGDAEFQTCLEEQYNERAPSSFSVPRKLPSGEYERYFRIDAEVEAAFAVSVGEADAAKCPDGGTVVNMKGGTFTRCEGRTVAPKIGPY